MRLRALLVIVLSISVPLACSNDVPQIDTTGMEPAVRELIETRRAELLADGSSASWGALGNALLAHGLESRAAECYGRAAKSADDSFDWLYLQALATTRDEAAIALFEQALRQRPNDGLTELRIGLRHQSGGRHEDALRAFEEAALHQPDLQRAHRGVGQAQLALGRYAEAVEALERALELDGGDAAAWSAAAQAYSATGRTDVAREAARYAARGSERSGFRDPLWRRHVLTSGVSVSRRFERALDAIAKSDPAAAREQLEAILLVRPDDPDAHYLSGSVARDEGEAMRHLERVLELDPDHVRALLDSSRLAETARQPNLALRRIEHALQLSPNDPSILLALAENRQRAGDYPRALTAYERLVELEPRAVGARINLGTLYGNASRWPAAEEQYAHAVRLAPERADARQLLTLARRRQGKKTDTSNQ